MKKIYTLILSLCCSIVLAQTSDYKKAATQEGSNYNEIVSQKRAEISARKQASPQTKAELKAEKQFERWAFYWKDRVNPEGRFPSELLGYYNAGILDANGRLIEQNNDLNRSAQSNQQWTNIGPQGLPEANGYPNFPQMGRLTNFKRYLKVPEAESVLFVSAPNGGIWKSIDNGATWAPKLDQIAGIGVTDMRSASNDATNPGTMYVSTGDYDAGHIKSIGVLKSSDFGETYQSTTLTFTLDQQESTSNLIVINDDIVNNDDTIIVGTNKFIKKSTDSGVTWTNVYTHNYDDAAIGKFHRNGNNIMCSGSWGGLFFSSNNGDSWTALLNEGNNRIRHASTSDVNGVFYVQNKAGQVFTYDPNNPGLNTLGIPTTNYNAQGDYNQAIVVKNGLVISGGVDAINSTNGGSSWYTTLNNAWDDNSSPGSYGHADIHEMGHLSTDPTTYSYWMCHDGGLNYVTYPTQGEAKPTVVFKSEGVLNTQMYSVAISPQSEDYLITGNQDNDGYSKEMDNGTLKWFSARTGDGTCTAIDYTNSGVRYVGAQNGGLIRADTGFAGNLDGVTVLSGGSGPATGAPFVWTLKMNTVTPNTLYAGLADVYKTANKGTSWSNLNSGAGKIEFIETFANNLLVIGETAAKKSSNEGGSWTTITEPDGTAKMNSLSLDQNNTNILYATVRGYNNGSKVYKSTNGGTAWTNISAGLPNILMKHVVLKQNQTSEIIFLGTELGMYYKVGTANWVPLGLGLPKVIINDVEINYVADKLVVATYGRGLWDISINNNTLGLNEQVVTNDLEPVIYPNPVSEDILNIKLNDNSANFDYIMYNVIGGVVRKGQLNPGVNTIDVKNVAAGIYVMRMTSGNSVSSQKIVIK